MPKRKHEQALHDEMLAMYQYVGETTGYWGRRFLAATKRKGGLAYAKQVLGKDIFIHVHHVKPLAARKGKSYTLNPRKDLVPVCPNCHTMLHRTDPPMTMGGLQKN
jgi:hypothetical protein